MSFVNPNYNIPSGFHADNYTTPAKKTVDEHLKAIDAALAKIAANDTFTVPTTPTGGTTVDTEARTAIASIITALTAIKTALKDHLIVKAS